MSKQLEGILNRAPRAIAPTEPVKPAVVAMAVPTQPEKLAATQTAEAPTTPKEREVSLGIEVPESVKRAVAIKAATEGVTNRTILLRALQQEGIAVPDDELRDRRR